MSGFIDRTAYIENSSLTDSTTVYRNCRIEGSLLKENTIVGDASVVYNSTLGGNVQLNRNSMVRETIIGDYSYGGMNFTSIRCTIGKYCSISWNVSVGGANHDFRKVTTHAFLYNEKFGMIEGNHAMYDRFSEECIIENDVWIGAGAQILRGVKVGNGAVVGAGAIVTKSVPPYSIVVGNPARIIRKRFDEAIIDKLEKTRWWDLPPECIRNNIELFNMQPDEDVIKRIGALWNT